MRATIKFPASGKWYYEGTVTTLGSACCIGAATNEFASPTINTTGSYYILVNSTGNVQRYNSFSSYTGFDTPVVGSILRVAYDADAQKLWLGLNALWMDGSTGTTGNPATGANPTFSSLTDIFPAISQNTSAVAVNYGQRAFSYTAPSGFKALVDTNLPAPVVAKPNTVFDAVPYTGSSGSQNIATNFSPDFVWVKTRNASTDHELYDVIRGAGVRLSSNNTTAENNLGGDGLTSFNSNGFTVPSTANYGINGSGYTYAAWAWDAGTSTVTNTAGSITASLRANASSGFSVSTFTGATTGTIGHGLGVAPSMIFIKARTSNPGANDWFVYHKDLGNTKYLMLNSTAAQGTYTIWNNTSPTSTVFSIGSGIGTPDWVAYCFAPVSGYSSFGSYTGGGSAGRFVYTGFRPKLIWVKNYNDGSYPTFTGWYMWDSVRGAYNYNQSNLNANSANIEGIRNTGGSITSIGVDILSNGFCLRGPDDADTNWSSGQYIYCAWAESPFQYARAR
jgi:hypothetical protein